MEQQNKIGSYSTDLTPLFKTVWRNLPYPLAKAQAQLNVAEDVTAPRADLAYGGPMWFRLKVGGVMLPNEPLLTITGGKNIIMTQVAGSTGRGSVKEMISEDDYRVNIKGILVRDKNRFAGTNALVPPDYPEEQLRDLVNLWRRNVALDAECVLLAFHGIEKLVFQDISWPGIPGSQGYIAYEINAVSDEATLAQLIRTT